MRQKKQCFIKYKTEKDTNENRQIKNKDTNKYKPQKIFRHK